MPRRPRLVINDVPLHIIQRGNNRHACFILDSDYLVYLDLLERAARAHDCAVHAYALMTNHVHLLATPIDRSGPAQMMKAVGERYVRYFNQRHDRTGTLWDSRFKSCLVHDETYLMVCYRYIELNPLRAGMVDQPSHYRWSSHQCNVGDICDPLITPHPLYHALGSDTEARGAAYRALFDHELEVDHIETLRDATNHNFVCGDPRHANEIEKHLGCQAFRRSRGARIDAM